MKAIGTLLALARLSALVLAHLTIASTAAQPAGNGSIEGRVFDATRREYLENARVAIEGTALEAFTDSSGTYRIGNGPTGTARVKVSFTGIPSQTEAIVVSANRTTSHDITLRGGPGPT